MTGSDTMGGGMYGSDRDGVRAAFADRILPFTDSTAPVCASLHIPDPRSERDAMIAATAIEHQFTVVTRNVSDFADTGVALVNPWLAGQ